MRLRARSASRDEWVGITFRDSQKHGMPDKRQQANPDNLAGTVGVILAGGLGTRLRPVFSDAPKCMAPVGRRRFLEYLMLSLRDADIDQVVLCVGYGRTKLRRWLARGSRWGVHLTYSSEQAPLGTAGALKHAQSILPRGSLLVLNGDSFLDVDLRALIRFHCRRRALVTIALARVADASRYGTVELDGDGRITAFREKSSAAHRTPSAARQVPQHVNGGVYIMESSVLDMIPSGRFCSLERDIFPFLVRKELYGFAKAGYFIDIGIPDDYRRAQLELPKRFPR
jgi:NDP-sugar pyrophosphorylase family protein